MAKLAIYTYPFQNFILYCIGVCKHKFLSSDKEVIRLYVSSRRYVLCLYSDKDVLNMMNNTKQVLIFAVDFVPVSMEMNENQKSDS